ncbi:unnamed protein product [Penicillium bialowiezense]
MASENPNLMSFETLGEGVSLYKPKENAGPPAGASGPSLVILCTWVGGATPRRINKYISQYQLLYPATSVLVLTSNVVNVAFRPLSMVRSRLKTACTLLHMFSHGGAITGSQFALAMRETEDQGAPFFTSLKGIILDCCPGDNSLGKSYAAARVAVPNNPGAQFLGKAFLYPAMSVVVGLQHAGVLRSVSEMRALLNDPNTFGSSPGRLYVYTKEDPVIGWTDVQEHIEEARDLGYRVEQVLFEHGAHCGLIMENPTQYWGAVQRFWGGEKTPDLQISGPSQLSVRSRL